MRRVRGEPAATVAVGGKHAENPDITRNTYARLAAIAASPNGKVDSLLIATFPRSRPSRLAPFRNANYGPAPRPGWLKFGSKLCRKSAYNAGWPQSCLPTWLAIAG